MRNSYLIVMLAYLFMQSWMEAEQSCTMMAGAQIPGLAKEITEDMKTRDISIKYHRTTAWQDRAGEFLVTTDSGSDEEAMDVQQTLDGGYIAAGYIDLQSSDILLLKYDASGALEWAKATGNDAADYATSVQQTADEGYVVTGGSWHNSDHSELVLLKYDSSGALSWATAVGGVDQWARGDSVRQTPDGGYIVAGETRFNDGRWKDVLVVKFDAVGAITWIKVAGGGAESNETAESVSPTTDGGYIVTGYTYITDQMSDILLLKYDSLGELCWAKLTGSRQCSDHAAAVVQTTDSGFLVAGTTWKPGTYTSYTDIFLFKYDEFGELLWTRTVGDPLSDEEAYSVQQTTDGGCVVAGYNYHHRFSVLLLKFDDSGALAWASEAGGSDVDHGHSVRQTADSGYIITGYTRSFGANTMDVIVAKVDGDGLIQDCQAVTSCSPETSTLDVIHAVLPIVTSIPSFPVSNPSYSSDDPVMLTSFVCPEPTPTATTVPTPTSSPGAETPTATPIQSTPTPYPSEHCFLLLLLNQSFYLPDDLFTLSVLITPSVSPLTDRLFVVLDVWGYYYFHPSWTEQLDYERLNWPAQDLPQEILAFRWPLDAGSARGLLFYAAVLDQNFNLVSNLTSTDEFGYGVPS